MPWTHPLDSKRARCTGYVSHHRMPVSESEHSLGRERRCAKHVADLRCWGCARQPHPDTCVLHAGAVLTFDPPVAREWLCSVRARTHGRARCGAHVAQASCAAGSEMQAQPPRVITPAQRAQRGAAAGSAVRWRPRGSVGALCRCAAAPTAPHSDRRHCAGLEAYRRRRDAGVRRVTRPRRRSRQRRSTQTTARRGVCPGRRSPRASASPLARRRPP